MRKNNKAMLVLMGIESAKCFACSNSEVVENVQLTNLKVDEINAKRGLSSYLKSLPSENEASAKESKVPSIRI